ncbi:MAG: SIS domain-containing protein [Candidatus Nanopelagicales bacterium]|nr:SIS domain-containing protein [Candidatus Nanopelagicales bacterium]
MDPVLFGHDLERTPETLRALAANLRAGNPWHVAADALDGVRSGRRLVLLGMGSSHFASSVLALRLQAAGINAIAVLASTEPLPSVQPSDVVVAVSASGGSAETVDAIGEYTGHCSTIAVTNTSGSAIETACDAHISMLAEKEEGGVACRSFAHTLGLHLALQELLVGGAAASDVVDQSADACADLFERRSSWLEAMSELLLGPDETSVVGPARRLSSAQQSALMLREGPRLPAIACETGDWSHVDVYLTKTTDYRMLLLPGSRWEPQLLDWCEQRGSTVVALGGDIPGAQYVLRYAGDTVDEVRLLSEPLVGELIAQNAWTNQAV